MSEASNNAELSGGYGLLLEALKATFQQKQKPGLLVLNPDSHEIKCIHLPHGVLKSTRQH